MINLNQFEEMPSKELVDQGVIKLNAVLQKMRSAFGDNWGSVITEQTPMIEKYKKLCGAKSYIEAGIHFAKAKVNEVDPETIQLIVAVCAELDFKAKGL